MAAPTNPPNPATPDLPSPSDLLAQMDAALQAMRTLVAGGGMTVQDRVVQRVGADRIRYVYTDQAMDRMPADESPRPLTPA